LSDLEQELRTLLDASLEDVELLRSLEALATKDRAHFDGLTPVWGPELYRKNRVLFRPFILSHFSVFGRWRRTPWNATLQAWLGAVDRDDEIELFRRLYRWRWNESFKKDVVARYHYADQAQRPIVLDKYEGGGLLDEKSAVELYKIDRASADFIRRHIPFSDKKPWRELWGLARSSGDEELYFALYRQQVPIDEWVKEATEIAGGSWPIDRKVAELERRQPIHHHPKIGAAVPRLLDLAGEGLLPWAFKRPYLLRAAYQDLIALAEKRDWIELWAAVLRTCSTPQQYERELKKLISANDATKLAMIAGRLFLSDEVALLLYDRFPELARGPFRGQLFNPWGDPSPKLFARLEEKNDDELIDFLASRMVVVHPYTKPQQAALAKVAAYYQSLDDPLRAARVIGWVRAHAVWNFRVLLERNELANHLYRRDPSGYLDRTAIRDLLESPSIHAQALAFRALASPDPRAPALAGENLDLLLAALLRPLHRPTRRLAFGALENAGRRKDDAAVIVVRAHEAMDLPDKRYPKEDLIGLIGVLIHRHPELQLEKEKPTIYRRPA
jgi:hypothetical protein